MERSLSFNYLLGSLVTGLALGSALPVLPSLQLAMGIVFLSLLLLPLYVHYRRSLLLYGAGFLWGLCVALFHGHHLHDRRLPDSLAGSDWQIVGVIMALPERTAQGERFDVRVERVLHAPLAMSVSGTTLVSPGRLRLNYYRSRQSFPANEEEFQFQPGQRWQLWVRLRPPRGFVNEGSFDYEGWLLQQGYHASGYVREAAQAQRLPDQACHAGFAGMQACMDRSAFHFLQWISRHVEPRHRALFAALTIGYGADFDRTQWDVLKNTGTIHLVVVSGFHVSLMAGLGYGFFALLARMLFVPLRYLPVPVWGATGAVLVATGFAVLSGLTLPVQRALVMVLCGLAAWLLRRRIPLFTAFLLACLLVLYLDPLAMFSASFWLSFGAVAILLYVFAARIRSREKYRMIHLWLKTQLCVSIGMFPLLAFWMGSVPLISPVANLIAVPYVTFVVLPLLIMILVLSVLSPEIAVKCLALSDHSMDIFWWILQQFDRMNNTVYFAASDIPEWLVIVLAMVAVAIVLVPRGIFINRYYQYALATLLFLPMCVPWQEKVAKGEFVVTALDVGQGLSTLIETEHHMTVYDTGDRFSDHFDLGRDLVAQQILRRGHPRVHTLIISHADGDHAGGLEGLLDVLPAERLLSGNPEIIHDRLQQHSMTAPAEVVGCQAGQYWQIDGVDFRVLSPPAGLITGKRNNRSCVIKVSSEHGSLLLSGDIHEDQERWLADQMDSFPLASDVLLVPHHGSKSSSSERFIAAVNPRMALTSVGYHSRYGHPHPEVVERYHQRGILFLRTDHSGAIQLSSAEQFRQIRQARLESGRYWHRW